MRKFQIAAVVVLAFTLQACSDGSAAPKQTPDVGRSPAASGSPTTLSATPSSELEDVALTLDELGGGTTVITPLNCIVGGAPPAGTSIVAERVCRTAFRLADKTAVSYGSYLFADEQSATIIAPLLGSTVGKSTAGIKSVPKLPEELMATALQIVSLVGDTPRFTELITFAHGRIVIFISLVALQDPTQIASDIAQIADERARRHF